MKKTIGTLLVIFGLAFFVWLFIGAETTGSGLQLGILVMGVTLPASVFIFTGFGSLVFGLVIANSQNKAE